MLFQFKDAESGGGPADEAVRWTPQGAPAIRKACRR